MFEDRIDEILNILDELNSQDKIEYDAYVQLHNSVSNLWLDFKNSFSV